MVPYQIGCTWSWLTWGHQVICSQSSLLFVGFFYSTLGRKKKNHTVRYQCPAGNNRKDKPTGVHPGLRSCSPDRLLIMMLSVMNWVNTRTQAFLTCWYICRKYEIYMESYFGEIALKLCCFVFMNITELKVWFSVLVGCDWAMVTGLWEHSRDQVGKKKEAENLCEAVYASDVLTVRLCVYIPAKCTHTLSISPAAGSVWCVTGSPRRPSTLSLSLRSF